MKEFLAIQRGPASGAVTDLRALVTVVSNSIERLFAKRPEVPPTWVAFKGMTQFFINSNFAEKDDAVAAVRKFFAKNEIERYVFIDEAWIVERCGPGEHFSKEEYDKFNKIGLSSHPERREVVMLSAEDHFKQILARRYILRPATGNPTLGPLIIDESGAMQGRMVGMLPPKNTRQ